MPIEQSEKDVLDALTKQLKGAGLDDKQIQKGVDAYVAAREAPGLDKDSVNKVAGALKDASRQIGQAVNAFEAGDAVGGTGAVMDICATISGVISGMEGATGAAGSLLGALFGLLALILRACAPKQQSVTDKIEGMLRGLFGESYENAVKSAIRDYKAAYSYLEGKAEDKAEKNEYLTESEMEHWCPVVESQDGLSVYAAAAWLAKPDNQSKANKEWHAVLDANLHAGSLQLRNYMLAFSILDPSKRRAIYKSFVTVLQTHLQDLDELEKAVRGKSLVWSLDLPDEFWGTAPGGHPYVRRMEQENDNQNLGGEARTYSAARLAGSDTALHFSLEGGVFSYASEPFPVHNRTYVRSVGVDLTDGFYWTQIEDLNHLHDVHALPGQKPGQVNLFETHAGGSAVYTYEIDAANTPRRVATPHANAQEGRLIRAVPGDAALSYYLLQRWQRTDVPGNVMQAQILTSGGHAFSLPWPDCNGGIATCGTFLWAFLDREIAYIPHEEALKGNAAAWRVLALALGQNGVPGSSEDWMRLIKCLSPSDDQLLVAVMNKAPYKTSWKRGADGSVELGPWELVPNIATVRAQRMPLRVWPQYEERRQTLRQIIAAAPSTP